MHRRGEGLVMYLARFSYNVLPIDRKRAVDFIRREVDAARSQGLRAQLLVPLTRGQGDPALQFEIELTTLDQLEQFRHRGAGSDRDTANWMQAFSEILTTPPAQFVALNDARWRSWVPWGTSTDGDHLSEATRLVRGTDGRVDHPR